MEITTWLRAFFAVRERAAEERGLEEIHAGTSERRAWPRTTACDAASIASHMDPTLCAFPLRFGGRRLGRCWRACVDDLPRRPPHVEYPRNALFWHTLGAICVYLHATGAPLPARALHDFARKRAA